MRANYQLPWNTVGLYIGPLPSFSRIGFVVLLQGVITRIFQMVRCVNLDKIHAKSWSTLGLPQAKDVCVALTF